MRWSYWLDGERASKEFWTLLRGAPRDISQVKRRLRRLDVQDLLHFFWIYRQLSSALRSDELREHVEEGVSLEKIADFSVAQGRELYLLALWNHQTLPRQLRGEPPELQILPEVIRLLKRHGLEKIPNPDLPCRIIQGQPEGSLDPDPFCDWMLRCLASHLPEGCPSWDDLACTTGQELKALHALFDQSKCLSPKLLFDQARDIIHELLRREQPEELQVALLGFKDREELLVWRRNYLGEPDLNPPHS